MARRRRDEDDDFDDHDERPRRRRLQDEPSTGMGLWLGLGLGVAALVVTGVIVLVISSRKKKDEVAQTPSPAPQPAPKRIEPPNAVPPRGQILHSKPAQSAPRGRPAANWQKAIGLWRRQPAPGEAGSMPVEFEFRKDFTARAQHDRPNDTVIHETLVEVQLDQGDFLTLILHMENGQYSYGFKVRPDGTLTLDGRGNPDLVYVKVK